MSLSEAEWRSAMPRVDLLLLAVELGWSGTSAFSFDSLSGGSSTATAPVVTILERAVL